ncbi:cystathionine gamma-synthase [Moelleriella libera RCEF 2490]|uniref:cystathionine gamma-synthase n=1 Tax=Moelleriella libera RCEF 2490 TaxID=1081109 RepID=A0A168A3P1_9HYPO|nr:cystathionine gamma-synthase [Moelleriella libera RCEF 2490]
MLFPTLGAATRCIDFVIQREPRYSEQVNVVQLVLDVSKAASALVRKLAPTIAAVMLPREAFSLAKQYWQHSGDGISSRRAEFCHALFKDHLLVPSARAASPASKSTRGPRRYQRSSVDDTAANGEAQTAPAKSSVEESQESLRFLEERFGRNLDLNLVERAKSAIRRRIAGSVVQDIDLQSEASQRTAQDSTGRHNIDESNVYLFPAGMNAIFNAHRALLAARGPLKSINFGFPYVDTLKILQKFGPGCEFFGHASSDDLDELETLLRRGVRFLALFCEFPGNPLLTCPDLKRIRRLADEFDFAVVVDETIGTFANVNVLPAADIVVSSLTKIFSGDSNVMGGSAIINPDSKFCQQLKGAMDSIYEDTYWPEDAVFMERNSRDFLQRIIRINANAEAICATLQSHPNVKRIYYPKLNPSKNHYDDFKLPEMGYGGLLSVVFHRKTQAQVFYDAISTAKGPSLGTNFTLCSPYVILAHYQELEWAASFGVAEDLVRVSVGLEETRSLQTIFERALRASEENDGPPGQ